MTKTYISRRVVVSRCHAKPEHAGRSYPDIPVGGGDDQGRSGGDNLCGDSQGTGQTGPSQQ
jgi:hypothetical protein